MPPETFEGHAQILEASVHAHRTNGVVRHVHAEGSLPQHLRVQRIALDDLRVLSKLFRQPASVASSSLTGPVWSLSRRATSLCPM